MKNLKDLDFGTLTGDGRGTMTFEKLEEREDFEFEEVVRQSKTVGFDKVYESFNSTSEKKNYHPTKKKLVEPDLVTAYAQSKGYNLDTINIEEIEKKYEE